MVCKPFFIGFVDRLAPPHLTSARRGSTPLMLINESSAHLEVALAWLVKQRLLLMFPPGWLRYQDAIHDGMVLALPSTFPSCDDWTISIRESRNSLCILNKKFKTVRKDKCCFHLARRSFCLDCFVLLVD